MQAILTKQQHTALLKKAGAERLNQSKLADILGVSRRTVWSIFNSEAPVKVNAKTFTAINDWLLSDLD